MHLAPNTTPKLRALADETGKLEIHFEGHRLPTLAAAIGAHPTGEHILTVQFALPTIEIGQAPKRPVPVLIAAPMYAHSVDP